ncbi:hypothetical protein N0V84_000942 [Fusarium piperis]|uniref:Apple domain-containing protein n=1 Tax=Fusarium piperis TaxID=1435070 RepID=A0A9W8WM19_9HYPO|nr:hypothetical protein N0V84_000942 [Fusarium piperis]
MVHYKSLLVALATVSAVVARPPCRPDTTAPVLSTTTTAVEEATSTGTSTVQETSSTTADETSSTIASTTTAADETSTTDIPTTTTTEADVSTTSTAPQTTTSAPTPPEPVCGITGYFISGQELTLIHNPGPKGSAEECLEGCASYDGCEVIAFYYRGSETGRCEYFTGDLVTDGQDTPYKWYDVGCLAE